jgi:hypothetical protein
VRERVGEGAREEAGREERVIEGETEEGRE